LYIAKTGSLLLTSDFFTLLNLVYTSREGPVSALLPLPNFAERAALSSLSRYFRLLFLRRVVFDTPQKREAF
jgi:hypothetical protein